MQQPEQQPPTNTADDWTELRDAFEKVRYFVSNSSAEMHHNIPWAALQTIYVYGPKLLDRYAELWEMTMAMMSAWEKLNQSKDAFYVPDAGDMIQLKNEGSL